MPVRPHPRAWPLWLPSPCWVGAPGISSSLSVHYPWPLRSAPQLPRQQKRDGALSDKPRISVEHARSIITTTETCSPALVLELRREAQLPGPREQEQRSSQAERAARLGVEPRPRLGGAGGVPGEPAGKGSHSLALCSFHCPQVSLQRPVLRPLCREVPTVTSCSCSRLWLLCPSSW